MTCLTAFVRRNVGADEVTRYFEAKYAIRCRHTFTAESDGCIRWQFGIQIADISFLLTITQFLADSVRRRVMSRAYFGSEGAENLDNATELLFTCHIPYVSDEFFDIAKDAVAWFGGGYITSDTNSQTLHTYAEVKPAACISPAESNTAMF